MLWGVTIVFKVARLVVKVLGGNMRLPSRGAGEF